jgi:hypothetical protein
MGRLKKKVQTVEKSKRKKVKIIRVLQRYGTVKNRKALFPGIHLHMQSRTSSGLSGVC